MEAVAELSGVTEEALEALYYSRYPELVRLALLFSERNIAEELVQEAFVRTLRNLRRIKDPGALEAYVKRAVVNLGKSRLKRLVLERRALALADDASSDGTSRLALIHAVRKLPPRQRACIALRYFDDLTENETAALLGTSRGTVKSQTHKALRSLRRQLIGDEE